MLNERKTWKNGFMVILKIGAFATTSNITKKALIGKEFNIYHKHIKGKYYCSMEASKYELIPK